VNEAIREVLSDALPTLKDPRIGFVTVTGVEATRDLEHAKVFVSVLGSEKERERTLAGLEAARGVLQGRVGTELRLRRTPVLAFEYDPTVERGVRLTKLIDELAPEAPMTTTDDMASVVAALRERDRFLVTSHEAPDGDALGSLLATGLALEQLGKDAIMFLGGEAPLPGEFRFLDLGDRGLVRELPGDVAERTLVAVDCASESRVGAQPGLVEAAPYTINIDHHHDNPGFGDVNLVVEKASSTGEVLADVFRDLDVELTPEIAEALYIALVTDTGRFQYANTTPKALRLAAELVEAGADVNRVFQGVYENVQFAKLKLLARALEHAQVLEGGEIVVSHLLRSDFEAVGATEPYSEGIIDVLRSVEGSIVSALIREPPRDGGPTRKVSLRSSVDEVDVSAIARKSGGGGHREAAGFSSELTVDELTGFIVREVTAQVAGSAEE
jgi:bifunctional oligoribonuclease and PAP phosphatase NrnA